ncbi:hypothetical protein PT286_00260 [Neisseriaceae bacterium ESL0693]|nr:hypothetical protein [Neisseriaceae bacterium ESL0693]
MARIKSTYLLGEGDTEKAFVKAYDFYGTFYEFNPYKKNFKKIVGKLRSSDHTTIVLICDADITNKVEIEKFRQNLKLIKKYSQQFILLIQFKCLEDELVFCSNLKNKNELCRTFNVGSIDKLKMTINKISNLKKHLDQCDFDLNKYASRYEKAEHLKEFHLHCQPFHPDLLIK